jgi:hypothetical protein
VWLVFFWVSATRSCSGTQSHHMIHNRREKGENKLAGLSWEEIDVRV